MSGFRTMDPHGRYTAAKNIPQPPPATSNNNNNNNFQQQMTTDSLSKLSSLSSLFAANANGADEYGLLRNPLSCLMCNQIYQNPCLLSCYHTFCAACLKGRVKEGKIGCPLCGKVTHLRDGQILPPPDGLLRFLVESTCEEFPTCANCDRNAKSPMFFCNTCVCWSSQKDCDHYLSFINKETGLVLGDVKQLPMFYCNTCGQALCGPCRDETHRAKMFSQHEIIHLSKKSKDLHKKCTYHNEPYTMYCTRMKTLLCVKCYRDATPEDRVHCIDVETAYSQGAKKLDRSLTAIRDLQTSLKDGAILFRGLVEELRSNMELEREGIDTTHNLLRESIQKQYDSIIKDLEGQYASKDVELKDQLTCIGTMLPTVQMHLILSTTFSNTASKQEFLNLAHQLIERLNTLAHLTFPQRPAVSTDINTHYKVLFAQCLEPITATLSEATTTPTGMKSVTIKGGYSHGNTYPPKRTSVESASCLNLPSAGLGRLRNLPQEVIKKQTLSARGLSDKEFTKHCRGFEGQIKDLNGQFNSIRKQVSDLHRDVTTRGCVTSYKKIENIVFECTTLTDELEKTDSLMQERKSLFNRMWDEEQQRIATEQAIFKEQLSELSSLRTDLKQLMSIARQLEPYIRTFAAVGENTQQLDHGKFDPREGSNQLTEASRSQTIPTRRSQTKSYSSTSTTRASSAGRQQDYDRFQSEKLQSKPAQTSKAPEFSTSPPSDTPTPLPPPMQTLPSSSSPAARNSSYDRHTIKRPSSREGMLSQRGAGPATTTALIPMTSSVPSSTISQIMTVTSSGGFAPSQIPMTSSENVPVRDTLPTWCSNLDKSNAQPMILPPIQQQQGTQTDPLKTPFYASSDRNQNNDYPLAEPPLEYSNPTDSVDASTKKSSTEPDGKKSLLSSLLDKVKPKEDSNGSSQKLLKPQGSAPLASVESLTPSESNSGSTLKRISSSVTGDSVTSVVHKPYEPPAIGKTSRVTPVGLDEEPVDRLSSDGRLESDNVEVVSLIRFNKSKIGSSSTTASEKPSGSSSDTNSAAALLLAQTFQHQGSSCPACDMAAQMRGRSNSASSVRSRQQPNEDYYGLDGNGRAESVMTSCSTRRSSAPEIDEKENSRISPSNTSIALSSRASGHYSSRSLERPRSSGTRRQYASSSLGRPAKTSGYNESLLTETSSSDSESVRNESRRSIPTSVGSRFSVGSMDHRDLERAVAHLQESLHEQLKQQVKALVHRGPESGSYNSDPACKLPLQQQQSPLMSFLGPYDTIKPSKTRRNHNNNRHGLPRQSSGDNLLQLNRRKDIHPGGTLKRADSFEGHEEAVRNLVEVVHESRKFDTMRRKPAIPKNK